LDVIAAIEILRSGKPIVEKLLWILFILLFPIIGKRKLSLLRFLYIWLIYRFGCLLTLWSNKNNWYL